MPAKETYEYAVIRLVPRVEREEFLNVGVILYAKRHRYLDMRFELDKDRITAFAPEVDISEIEQYLNGWVAVCEGAPHGGRIGQLEQHLRFRWLVAARSTILQSSRTHPGIGDDPAAVLERLFVQLVGRRDL